MTKEPIHSEIAGLTVRIVEESQKPLRGAVVLCHGFGASSDDLVPLAQELRRRNPALEDVRFYFPQGPLALPFPRSWAWWHIDAQAMRDAAFNQTRLDEHIRQEPDGLPKARALLHAFLANVTQGSGLPYGRVAVGGFSQGAMLATDVALRTEEPCAGLAILSGTLVAKESWARLAPKRTGFSTFIAHGRDDLVLPYPGAVALRALLEASGLSVQFLAFAGGHTIVTEEVKALGDFFEAALRRQPLLRPVLPAFP